MLLEISPRPGYPETPENGGGKCVSQAQALAMRRRATSERNHERSGLFIFIMTRSENTLPRTVDTPASMGSSAAERALSEAKARRDNDARRTPRQPEIGGPSGPDPVRYGDWERKGIASDF